MSSRANRPPIIATPLALLLAALGLASPGSLMAAEGDLQSRRLERRTSVHADGGLVLSVPSKDNGLSAGALGLSAAHIFTRRLAAEVSLGRIVNESGGFQAGLGLRLSQPFGLEDRWAVHLGAGPAMTFGKAFGRTVLGRGEIGIEFRARSGVVAGYSAAVESALAATQNGDSAARRLESGDTGLGWRLSLGYAF